MSLLPAYRGVRIFPFMEKLRYYIFSFFFLLFSPILVFFVYSNFEKIKNVDVFSIVVSVVMLILIIGVSIYLTWLSQERIFYFQKRERESRLAFFLRENGYTYTKKVKTDSGTRDKVVFPVVYMKQNRYDLEIAFKMAGNKFQDKFKKIGSELETTFFMDFMEVQDDVKLIFEAYSKEKNLHIVPNVYPKIDILNIEPTREVIQNVFEKHIIEAKGMEKIREMVNGTIIPTPGAVMKASKILKDEIGDLVTIDVGGATTDIHSVTEGTEKVQKVLIEPEPIAKRTVEGDLGVFINKKNVAEMIKIKRLEKELDMTSEEIEEFINSDIAIPESEKHKRFIERLTKEAVIVSINRHAGGYRTYFGGKSQTLAFGKDLTAVKWIIGTGGALTRLPAREKILSEIALSNKGDKLLPTAEAKILIDNDYIMASLGVLSSLYKEASIKLLFKSLNFEGSTH